MSDDEVDIRQVALRRHHQRRSQSRATVEQLLDSDSLPYTRFRSGRSSYESPTPKSYVPEVRSTAGHRKSYLSAMPVPIFEEDTRVGRMNVPPVVKCECNGVEAFALVSSSETVSTISMDLVSRMRLTDQVIPEPSRVYNPLAVHQPDLKGKVKYIDLELGNWQQIAQFNVVDSSLADLTLGIDFLRRTQTIVNFEESYLMVGGQKGEKVPFLNTRDVMLLARKNANQMNYATTAIKQ